MQLITCSIITIHEKKTSFSKTVEEDKFTLLYIPSKCIASIFLTKLTFQVLYKH